MKEPGIEPGFFAFGGWTNNRENVSKCMEIALRMWDLNTKFL